MVEYSGSDISCGVCQLHSVYDSSANEIKKAVSNAKRSGYSIAVASLRSDQEKAIKNLTKLGFKMAGENWVVNKNSGNRIAVFTKNLR